MHRKSLTFYLCLFPDRGWVWSSFLVTSAVSLLFFILYSENAPLMKGDSYLSTSLHAFNRLHAQITPPSQAFQPSLPTQVALPGVSMPACGPCTTTFSPPSQLLNVLGHSLLSPLPVTGMRPLAEAPSPCHPHPSLSRWCPSMNLGPWPAPRMCLRGALWGLCLGEG